MQEGGYFAWLQRMGIYKSYGSYPGFEAQYRPKWERAKQLGLVLFADSSGDSNWLNDNQADGQISSIRQLRLLASSNRPTRSTFAANLNGKSYVTRRIGCNALSGNMNRRISSAVMPITLAAAWCGRVRATGSSRYWQLGLDRYQDAWDIHAYPQQAPLFDGPIGNGESEDERGVLATYASLGRKNTLPFWLGETGAKAMHGLTGRRWQAEQVAKMISWVNSRNNYLGLAFCIGHEYDLAYGRIWDYSMGHKPGEAALYTASALIDGLPYQAFDAKDANIQAAYFGESFMIWRIDEATGNWPLQLDPGKSWVLVDVVGHIQELPVDASGFANIPISASPVYVLARSNYERLTRH